MKSKSLIIFTISASLSCFSYGAGYISNITGSPGDQLVSSFPDPGVDGWTQSEANNAPNQPKAWISNVGTNGNLGIAIGGFYDEYAGSEFNIARSFSPLAMNGASMSMTIGLVDPELFLDRNDFSISLIGPALSSLITINLLANTQTFPADNDNDRSWNVAVNGDPAFAAIFAGAAYFLSMDFIANGADLDYTVSIIGGVGSAQVTSGSLAGLASTSTTALVIGTTIGEGDDWGDNIFGFSAVQIIPEPSSALLIALGAFGLMRRKRTA